MANELGRVQVILTGFTGAPGLMYFHYQGSTPGAFSTADATAAIAAVRQFLFANSATFGAVVSLQVQSAVEVVDWVTGALLRLEAGTGAAVVVGSATSPVLTAEGPLIQWFTQTVINRRLLRGRQFLIPSGTSAVTATGAVAAARIAAGVAAGNALIATAGPTFSIWHRPVPFASGSNGTVGAVISCAVPDKVAVLRSRRD